MIKSIKIQNFQSHKNTELLLSEGVNCLTGSSDSGKTAVLRALNWLFSNRPTGTSYIHHGENECEVSIEINNNVIKRLRTKTKNAYYLNEQEFLAIGNNVPDEITQVLNLSELNTQSQHDSPFLVFDSPGQISKTISEVINLESGQNAISSLQSQKRNSVATLKVRKTDIEAVQATLSDFMDLETLDSQIGLLEALIDQNDANTKWRDDIGTTLLLHREVEKNILNLHHIDLDSVDNLESCVSDYNEITSITKKIKNPLDELIQIEEKTADLIDIDERLVDELESENSELLECTELLDIVEQLLKNVLNIDKDITDIINMIVGIQQELEELLDQVDICPTCGQEIQDKERLGI